MVRIVIVLLVVVAACAPTTQLPKISATDAATEARLQREMAFQAMLEDSMRLHKVANQILRGGVELCGDRLRRSAGLVFATVHDYPSRWREAARTVANVGDLPRVLFTVPGSPADVAGVKAGDEIVAVGGNRVRSGSGASKQTARLLKAAATGSFTLTLARPRSENITITPDHVCDYRVVLGKGDDINAAADGSRIIVARGMMRFVGDDDELAMVVAHELAHNTMDHIDKKRGNVVAGMLVGAIFDVFAAAGGIDTGGVFTDAGARAGKNAYSKEFEAEADYVGLYVLERSGFRIEKAPNLWRRLATLSPRSVDFARTHPTSPERFVRIQAALREIRAKKAAGVPLEPTLKPREAPLVGDDLRERRSN